MPYLDMGEHSEALDLLNTVRDNFEGFTEEQMKRAILAREAHAMVAYPTDSMFKQLVNSKSLENCDVPLQLSLMLRLFLDQTVPTSGLGLRQRSLVGWTLK